MVPRALPLAGFQEAAPRQRPLAGSNDWAAKSGPMPSPFPAQAITQGVASSAVKWFGSGMTGARMLFGLDRLPSTLAADDARLPAVDVDATPLRLNSLPLPIEAWPDGDDHAARMAALRTWLLASCGDYNEPLRRAVTHYLDAIEAHIAHHHDALASGLARFHGLYQPEDWCWSALRPLPRAWWRHDDNWARADLAFWDGRAVIAMAARDFATGQLPAQFQQFWHGETLPVSPFRKTFPRGEISLKPSSP
jgi:hypothetical protein